MKCKASGKIVYDTYEKAEHQIRWLKIRKDQKNSTIYKCKHCGGWHTTSTRSAKCNLKRAKEPYKRQKIKRGDLSADLYD